MSIDVALPRPTRFSIGRVLGDSIKIFVRNIVGFALAALAIRLLLLLVPEIEVKTIMAGAGPSDWFSAMLSIAVGIVVASTTKAIVVFPTMQNLRGQRAAVSDLWRVVPFLPAIVAAGAILGVPSFVSPIVQKLFPGNLVVIGVTGLVVAIGTLIIILMWWIYAPTIAVEKGGVRQGLSRSRYLLNGQRWRVLALLVISSVASIAIVLVAALLAGLRLADLTSLASIQSLTPVGVVIFIAAALVTAFDGVLITVSYYHLRLEKEGAIAEDLVQVFD
jgi:hypothetical protein